MGIATWNETLSVFCETQSDGSVFGSVFWSHEQAVRDDASLRRDAQERAQHDGRAESELGEQISSRKRVPVIE